MTDQNRLFRLAISVYGSKAYALPSEKFPLGAHAIEPQLRPKFAFNKKTVFLVKSFRFLATKFFFLLNVPRFNKKSIFRTGKLFFLSKDPLSYDKDFFWLNVEGFNQEIHFSNKKTDFSFQKIFFLRQKNFLLVKC